MGVGIEASRNVAESTVDKWMKHVSADILPRVEKAIDDNTRARLEDSQGSRPIKKWFEGEISGVLHADVLGYFALNIYGACVTTTVVGAVRSHVFNVDNDHIHSTLTIFRKDAGIEGEKYHGGIVSSLEITASVDDYVRFTAGMMAIGTADDSSSPSYTTEYDFISRDIVIKVATSAAGLTGATAIKAKTINIKYDTGAVSDFVFGSYFPDSNYQNRLAIEVEFTRNHTDATFEDLYESGASRYMSITIQGEADIGTGNNPTVTLVLNNVAIEDWTRSGGVDDLVEETVTLKAFYNGTDGKQSELTIKNLTNAYT